MIGCAFAGMGMIGDGSGWRPDSSCRSVGRAGARPSQGPCVRATSLNQTRFRDCRAPARQLFPASHSAAGFHRGQRSVRRYRWLSWCSTGSRSTLPGAICPNYQPQRNSLPGLSSTSSTAFPASHSATAGFHRGQRSVRRYRWTRQNATLPATRLPLPPPPAHWQNTR